MWVVWFVVGLGCGGSGWDCGDGELGWGAFGFGQVMLDWVGLASDGMGWVALGVVVMCWLRGWETLCGCVPWKVGFGLVE